ncbi:hypothetical protein [Aeromicrobium sp.]|uniref:hypothetical protein n=1 Tax=Aeromicrobium sp. TaxID=1871063 RepID=UPI003C3534E7
MRKFLVVAAALITSMLVLTPVPAQANHSWGGYHWARTSNPFTLKLGDNVDSKWDSYLATTSSDWSQSSVLDTTIVAGRTRARTCKATSGRVEVCNTSYGSNGWLGIASISITGGTHITQGTVKLNDTYFNTAAYNTPAWRNLVSCQEVGHIFGLAHQDEVFDNPNLNTCMDYTNDPASNQHPNTHDYEQLVTIYSHLDATTTIGASVVSPSRAEVGNDPSSWGRLVSGSRSAGQSTYVRDFGRGNLVVTHVTWA